MRTWTSFRREDYAGAGNTMRHHVRRISPLERRAEAAHFIDQFAAETGATEDWRQRRRAEVRRELKRHGYYRHTPEELALGARLAWRNHGRCIGRLFWESMEVEDCRAITRPDEIAGALFDHMRCALGDGRVKSRISVFAPIEGDAWPARIESPQLTQYAGYRAGAGRVIGDRQNIDMTGICRSLGWTPPEVPSDFDMLPIVIRDADDVRHLFHLPDDTWRRIPIAHPANAGIGALGLEWYAVPFVSGLYMTVGGIDYPCAPFNGFYMATEIASRNLADRTRYDRLGAVADALGLDRETDPLWQDTALTELNRAVLHSYETAGVTIVDHHAASRQFMDFHAREQGQGRAVSGDWRWLVPPQAGSASDIFHLPIRNHHPTPNFYASRAMDGRFLMPWHGDRYRSRMSANFDRIRRRWTLWKRMSW